MFYELFKEFMISLALAMIIDAIFVHAIKGLRPILYSFAGSLAFMLVFGGMVTWRALVFFGHDGEESDGETD